jgi:hypothetical protein
MDADSPEVGGAGPETRLFQFSLATLYFLTTVLAIILSVCFAIPNWLAGILVVLLMLVVPAALVVYITYGSGRLPAFCIGAIFPSGVCLIGFQWIGPGQAYSKRCAVTDPHPRLTRGLRSAEWLNAASQMARFWRPMAVTSWIAAVFIGFICVGVRRFLRRRA